MEPADGVRSGSLDHPSEELGVGDGELVDEVLPGLGGETGGIGGMHRLDEQRGQPLDHDAAQQLAGGRVAAWAPPPSTGIPSGARTASNAAAPDPEASAGVRSRCRAPDMSATSANASRPRRRVRRARFTTAEVVDRSA